MEPDLETQKVTVDVADGSGIDGDALLEMLAAWANSAGKKGVRRRVSDDRRGRSMMRTYLVVTLRRMVEGWACTLE